MQGENAVLNVLTIPPGASITSPRIVLDGVRGAIFVYGSGGPTGALIGSWAGTAGTDPYSNTYPAGLNVGGFTSGAQIFVQSTTPTGTIPLNSLWINTSTGTALTWNGSAWVAQTFNAANLLQAGTITASLLIANIVVAGIVNGTEIDGSIFRVKNSSGATIMTINKAAGTWILYVDTGSSTQGAMLASAAASAVTDEFGNAVLAGLSAYGQAISGTWVATNFSVNSSAFGVIYYVATSEAGPWGVDSWLKRSGASTGQIEAGPIIEMLGTSLLPATPATGSKLWTPNNTNTLRVMKADGEPGYGVGETIYILPGTMSCTSGWAQVIATGGISLSVPVVSGQEYFIEGIWQLQNPTASTNTDLGFTGPTVSACKWFVHTQAGTTNPITGNISTGFVGALTFVAANFPASVNAVIVAHAWGSFTASANGTLSMAVGQANGLAFNVLSGTFLKVRTSH